MSSNVYAVRTNTSLGFDQSDSLPGLLPASRLVAEVGVVPPDLDARATDGALEQVADALLEHFVGRQSDGVLQAFGLQNLVDLGVGKGGIGAERGSKRAR